jgi:bisanhydrobacterioruberin hydratase
MQILNKITAGIKNNYTKTMWFFVIFYSVGIIGMIVPATFPLFVKLIPFALLLSVLTLALFHGGFSNRTLLVFLFIFLFGFFAEVFGVNTGFVFGNYNYGNGLGIKLFNTPLMIGINWLLLVYLTASLTEKLNIKPVSKVLLASVIMLGYDVVLEQVAPVLDMWYWQNNEIPLKNYITWFLLALFFHSIVRFFNIKTANKIAPAILICQFIFFVVLWITFKF